MKRIIKLYLLLTIGLIINDSVFSQNINFQFRDTIGMVGAYINVPIKTTTSFTGRGVVSYNLQFSFSVSALAVEGVVTTGTISSALGTPVVNISTPGLISFASAGTVPLSGTGNFIYLRCKILSAGVSSIVSTGSNYNFLNEGTPVLTIENDCNVEGLPQPMINVTPNEATLLKGESLQFGADGGTAPYTWSSTNTGVSSISASGLLMATQLGTTTVKATDANSYFGISGIIDIRSYRLSIPDTVGTYNSNISIPVRVTTLTGLNVISGDFVLKYNSSLLSAIQIETANSLLQAATPVINLSVPGTIQFSFANSNALSGAGVMFWIKCKLSNPSGGSDEIQILNAMLNESLAPVIDNGSVNYSALPYISINPNAADMVYGDSLQLVVEGSPLPPFVWSVSDNNIASINSQGLLKVKKSGTVSVTVTDARNAIATSDLFHLYDTHVKVADTLVLVGTQIDIPVFIKELPVGMSVYSIEGRIYSSDISLFSLDDLITVGSSSATFSVSSFHGTNYIQFAMAGVTPILSNAILFKIRGTLNDQMQSGEIVSLYLTDLVFNEGAPLPLLQPGLITATKAYRFIGNGFWSIPENWLNSIIPPLDLQNNVEIVIDPISTGECILNVEQHISSGSTLTIMEGKHFRILGDLNIHQSD